MHPNRDSGVSEIGVTVLAVVLLMLFIGGGFVLKTILAPATGRANAYQQQQSATNRIGQNSLFYDLKTDYNATVAKLPTYSAAAKTGDPAATTNLTGLQSHCADIVGQYASAAGKYLAKDFRDANLPESLDGSVCQAAR
ncbi:MAG: hypothetical protein NVS3B26_16510 [Mycobacteriales bacterium]